MKIALSTLLHENMFDKSIKEFHNLVNISSIWQETCGIRSITICFLAHYEFVLTTYSIFLCIKYTYNNIKTGNTKVLFIIRKMYLKKKWNELENTVALA